jgi:hypothetical protein
MYTKDRFQGESDYGWRSGDLCPSHGVTLCTHWVTFYEDDFFSLFLWPYMLFDSEPAWRLSRWRRWTGLRLFWTRRVGGRWPPTRLHEMKQRQSKQLIKTGRPGLSYKRRCIASCSQPGGGARPFIKEPTLPSTHWPTDSFIITLCTCALCCHVYTHLFCRTLCWIEGFSCLLRNRNCVRFSMKLYVAFVPGLKLETLDILNRNLHHPCTPWSVSTPEYI